LRHGQRIGVVIPALNEEPAIGQVIADIPAWVDEVVVADNGSVDRTAVVARAAGARVITEKQRGYGAACQAGISALSGVDIVVFVDGDYSDRPQEMAALVDPITTGAADFVVGSRVSGEREPGALTPQQRFGNWLACRLIGRLSGTRCSDLGPFRAIRAEALKRLELRDRAYGWTVEMQLRAAEEGLKYREVPVSYRVRIGTSKISGTVLGSLKAGVTILTVIGRSAWRARGLRSSRVSAAR
jgi:glycosyltransferase involved in cell wall biosynthesis